MSLLLYVFLLLVSLSSVLFGLGWLSSPEPQYKQPPALIATQLSPKLAPATPTPAAKQEARQQAPAAAPTESPVAAAPTQQAASEPAQPAAPTEPAPAAQAVVDDVQAPMPPGNEAQAGPPPIAADAQGAPPPLGPPGCNVAACTAAYHSFRAADCTYQPSNGPRRACTKGGSKPNAALPTAGEARAEAPRRKATLHRHRSRFCDWPC